MSTECVDADYLRDLARTMRAIPAIATSLYLETIAAQMERLERLQDACEAIAHADGKIYSQQVSGPKLKELNEALDATRKNPLMEHLRSAPVSGTQTGKGDEV